MIMRLRDFLRFLLIFFLLAPALFAAPALNGTIKVLAIRVEFKKDSAATTTGDGTFDLSSTSKNFTIDPPPHNRSYFSDHLLFLRNYFSKVSRNSLQIEGDVFPAEEDRAYRLDAPMTEYNPNSSQADIDKGLARLLRDALQKADEDPTIDFSQYDAFIVFHAGVGKDVDVGFDNTPQDIPSLFINRDFLQRTLGLDAIEVDNGQVRISNGIILPETESQEGLQLGLNGILAANFGSFLGLADLFSPETRQSGVGRFDLMDAGLFNGDGLLPALPSAWTRIDAGWERPQTVHVASDALLKSFPVLSDNPQRVYRIPINNSEYFLVENRYEGRQSLDSLQFELSKNRNDLASMREVLQTFFPDKARFSPRGVLTDIDNPDRGLPGSGILIWHIDESVIRQNRAANRINADPDHRGVDLEEADGSQDIGQIFDFLSGGAGSELGTALDFWYDGNSAPLFKNEFSDNSIPNSRSYANRAKSHIKIYQFSPRDSVMSFRVTFEINQTGYPTRVVPGNSEEITSLKTTDLDGDGSGELILTTSKNAVLWADKPGGARWNSSNNVLDSLSHPILPPPALFPLPDGNEGMVLTTSDGWVYGYEFNRTTLQIQELFPPVPTGIAITTFPIVEFNWLPGSSFPDNVQLDSSPNIYWGSADGTVSRLKYSDGQWVGPETVLTGQGAVVRLHFADPSQPIAVFSEQGKVSLPQGETAAAEDLFQPVGYEAVDVTRDGRFIEFLEQKYTTPENEVHAFESDPVVVNDAQNGTRYLISGNNRILLFNHNLTLTADYPVRLNTPDLAKPLTVAPLIGPMPGNAGSTTAGIIVTDPGGVIHGLDAAGKSLPDFPVALGDSIKVSPALLDIDGDGDTELAVATISGWLYVFDLPSDFGALPAAAVWRQAYGNEMNQNRFGLEGAGNNTGVGAGEMTSLLPARRAYNWPNPNKDNFTFIRYWLARSARVHIKIYDISGDLVQEIAGTGFPQTDNEVRWDLQSVQSGIYFARIEAEASGERAVRIIKIAVVK